LRSPPFPSVTGRCAIEPRSAGHLERAFEKGRLKSVATKAELAKFKAAARATAIKDRRVNIRLSSGDLSDIQVKAADVEPCGSPAPTFRRVIVAGVSFPAHRGGQTMKPLPNISVIVTAAACSLLFNLPETSFAQEAASPAAQAWIDVATFSGMGMPMGGMGGWHRRHVRRQGWR
jgi:hypothetical protein